MEVQLSIEVQALIEAQLRVMEIEMCELDVATKKKHVIMDIATHLEKGIHIPNPE